jgi:hypothetical protein
MAKTDDRESSSSSNGDNVDMAEMSVEMLRDVFQASNDDGDTILYSNAAVAKLLSELLDRYQKRATPRERLALLLHWQKDKKRLKKALRSAADEEPVKVDGAEYPHVNEARISSMMDYICPTDPYLPDPGIRMKKKMG